MADAGKTVMDLAEAAGGVAVAVGSPGQTITDVTHDSRQAGPGVLFVAVRGKSFDGRDFVPAAVEAGSPAVCVESEAGSGVAEIVVPDTRAALGPLASTVHDHPSAAMKVVGVTGTNGKTTVTHYLESMAMTAGRRTGLIGTIATHIGGESVESIHTTPEASDFQRLLARMRDDDVELVAAEVSSHALDLGRVMSTRFAVAAFTNLSQDHLDFHGDMDAYRRSKRRLFEEYEVGVAVINVDDPVGQEIADESPLTTWTVGRNGDFGHEGSAPIAGGTAFTLRTPDGSAMVTAPVVGFFNVDNAVLASACAMAAGVGLDDIVRGLHTLAGVPGRFEVVSGSDPITVIVDYAHTPDGIASAISAARSMKPRRVVVVVGAGGDRDHAKRPLMGSAASQADLTIITSENPRSEDPGTIIDAVAAGVDLRRQFHIEVDRMQAIELAVEEASDGDVVLILGRGHEPMQETAGVKFPFDDRRVARLVLQHRRSAESGPRSGSMAP
jgi:UDP-N-acetylmuramoyl-L-alanyl-D-glutamate--2,6-diaminopimelate ligase